jgi:thioredoxin 1
MKDVLIVFLIALVLGSVINGMQPEGNRAQQAQVAQAQTNEDEAEALGGRSDNDASVTAAPLESASDASFSNLVLNQRMPVLVDFYTQSCPHCKNMEPVLARLAGEYPSQLKIVKVDAMSSPSLALKYDVGSVPAFILFDQGKPVTSLVGEMSKPRLLAAIRPYLSHQNTGNIENPPISPAPNHSG